MNHAAGHLPSMDGKLPHSSIVRRVEQRTGNDCLRCCVAMVTAKSYEEVPCFVGGGGSWSGELSKWLASIGLAFVRVGDAISEVPAGSCSIEIGRTAAGTFHAVVVARERLDPDPLCRGFIEAPKHRLVLLPLVRGEGLGVDNPT